MSNLTDKLTTLNGAAWLLLDDETREELRTRAAESRRVSTKRYDPDTGESYLEEQE